MSGDAGQQWTADRNQTTVGFDSRSAELANITDELYSLLDYINVTLLPDVNATEAIDSFYFYEVSILFFLLPSFLPFILQCRMPAEYQPSTRKIHCWKTQARVYANLISCLPFSKINRLSSGRRGPSCARARNINKYLLLQISRCLYLYFVNVSFKRMFLWS